MTASNGRGIWTALFVVALTLVLPPICTAVRFRMFTSNVSGLCEQKVPLMCGPKNNIPHTYCPDARDFTKVCQDRQYDTLELDQKSRQNILDGHNGIRNRVANQHDNPVADMNFLYWDEDLARMARNWLLRCPQLEQDPCTSIGSHTVNQVIGVAKRFPRKSESWETSQVREWYLEGNAFKDEKDSKVRESWKPNKASRYTQLIWSKSEFIGCAAAKVKLGFTLACNYSPAGNVLGEPVNLFGDPCTQCSDNRSVCSEHFTGLCGVDTTLRLRTENNIYIVWWMIGILCFWFLGVTLFWFLLKRSKRA